MAQRILLLPGIGNSGPGHWQRLWADSEPGMALIDGQDWDTPVRQQWVGNLGATLSEIGPGALLVAHSLACLQVVHWASSVGQVPIGGALLVAVPDPDGPGFPSQATGFTLPPAKPLGFPAIVVASSDDPYAGLDFSRRFAEAWGCRFVDIGAKGHINGQSGLGEWPEGRALLEALGEGARHSD